MRARLILFSAFCILGILRVANLWGQEPRGGESGADDEKRRQFLKAREEMRTLPPATPAATPAVKPKPKPRATPAPSPSTPREAPEATPRPTKAELATPKPAPTPAPKPTPSPTPKPTEKEPQKSRSKSENSGTPRAAEKDPTPRPATPRPTPPPATPASVTPAPVTPRPVTPPPRPLATPPPAPVIIEKSGVEKEHGLQPAAPVGWFTRWKYLSRAVRQEIDRAPVAKRRWRYIVVHNSGTRQGNAKAFEYYHLRVRKMPNGLAYHFVVGNGSSSGDGEIEIGNRWRRQINGGHVHSDYLNNIALGICLVGDFNRDTPTQRQLAATEELIRYLRQRVGKIDRQWAIVKAHRDINPPRWPTDCPGDRFPFNWLRAKFSN